MEELTIKNEMGLELTVTAEHPKNYDAIMGGMEVSPSWEEYLSDFNDEYKPHIELIKKAITELGWVGETGERKANKWCFVFSDGEAWGFSWRAWGDLMSAIVGKKEGYMRYYM